MSDHEQDPSQPATPQASSPQSISVEIYDQIYNLRGTDPAHMEKLAALVDAKMRAVSATGSTVDSLRVAVLAALNITDELFTLRERYAALADGLDGDKDQASHSHRTLHSLSSLLDSVLEERKAG
jgi:cell division protein ZapA